MSDDFNRHALINSLGVIRDHHPDLLAIGVEMARKLVSDKIRAQLSNQVAYGPFKGLRLSAQSVWSSSDSGSMLLGLYEQEVLKILSLIGKADRTFVNLGASDGYYGIGVLVAGLYGHSYCYESNDNSRRLIQETATLNHVSEKITVFGRAEKGFYNQIPSDRIDKTTLLIDIEGGELDIIDKDFFKTLSTADIIIELHPWVTDFQPKISNIIIESQNTHDVFELTTGNRDLSYITEVQGFHDSYRWLLCSEGRPMQMSWLHFKPKASV